ncbi:amino acid transporter [Rhizobium sp. PP-CC-3G-465]|uniref:amino acid transporter n=1 Tax=Rhizobium sp. PP-CC-3G-465 TaxID=2135648 RepID=UPI0010CFBD52|nr:hypothetical protein C8J33_103183 [Rhizobium sp. PP-CC-3G-465]
MSLIHNERTKLTATYLNGVAIAIFAVGGFAPAIGWLNTGAAPGLTVAIVCLVCISSSVGLHFIERSVLKGLKP